MEAFLLIALVLGGLVAIAVMAQRRSNTAVEMQQHNQLDDAIADARRWIESGFQPPLSRQRPTPPNWRAPRKHTATRRHLDGQNCEAGQCSPPVAIRIWIAAAPPMMALQARTEDLQGQAGTVTETRTIEHEGHTITASPHATAQTPNYYPGGRVAGRPVPAGWYSEPWCRLPCAPALGQLVPCSCSRPL